MTWDIFGLIPPTAKDAAQDRWQRTTAGTLILVTGALIASSTSLGAAAYRARAEVETLHRSIGGLKEDFAAMLKEGVDRLDAGRIKGSIIAMQSRYCDAVRARNVPLAESLNTTISELQAEYYGVAGAYFPVRACA